MMPAIVPEARLGEAMHPDPRLPLCRHSSPASCRRSPANGRRAGRGRGAGLAAIAPALVLAACGGSSGASIGGTLSGLDSGRNVVLQDNGSDTLTLTSNGVFAFRTDLDGGSPYTVTILTQPAGQTCTLLDGSGSVDSAADPVSNVTVSCVDSASLTGTVSGLAAGTSVTLSDGTVQLPVAANGAFAFPGVLEPGDAYQVTVVVEPVGETCTVSNGSGTFTTDATPAIVVSCGP